LASYKPTQAPRAWATTMFTNDIIFSYTTKQAVEDGVLVKLDPDVVRQTPVVLPVYFTDTVWRRYVQVPVEFEDSQNITGRISDILLMFAFSAKQCNGSVMKFKFNCRIPKSSGTLINEVKSDIRFQFMDVELKAVISAQDIDDPTPAIFIMLPSED